MRSRRQPLSVSCLTLACALALSACSVSADTRDADAQHAAATVSAPASVPASATPSGPAVPTLPGYAPGTFPEVPAITIPDVSLLTDSAPAFGATLKERFAGLDGVTVTSAQCDADGALSSSSVSSSLYGGTVLSDDDRTVTTDDDGAGTYSDADGVLITNGGDGSGTYSDDDVAITLDSAGGGTYSDDTVAVTVDGSGGGTYSDATVTITNAGDGSGTYADGTVTITNAGDGSGTYADGTVTITNAGQGEARVTGPGGSVETAADPLPPLATVGDFPTLDALTPGNVCGALVSVESEVLFDFGSAEIRADAKTALTDIATGLEEVGVPAAQVIGHTDSVSDEAYNQALSEHRADAVVTFLENQGVTAALTASGQGETQPVAPNTNADGSDNPAGRQLNRRVEIYIPAF